MNASDKFGYVIGIIGGLGLGLLLGSEFSERYVTLFGAGLLIISIIAIALMSYRRKIR